MELEKEVMVEVLNKVHKIFVHRKSKGVWIATGEFNGASITVQDKTQSLAVKRWCEAARDKGN
jgi:hypothetical protein